MNTRVRLSCPDCPRKHPLQRRSFGEVDFPEGIPSLFIYRCPRGHAFGIRPLSREERRARPDGSAEYVASRWEG